MKRSILAIVLTFALAIPAWADWDKGWDAYKNRDYMTASREFMALADKGDARAQVTILTMALFDEGGPWADDMMGKLFGMLKKSNLNEAVKWFRNAANQGDTKAGTLLAQMYGEGLGVPKDFDESSKLLLKAAEQGEVTAQKYLAFMLAFQNKITESQNWTRKAAEQGDRWGQRGLGLLYRGKDKVRAYMWYTLAVEQGSKRASKERDAVARGMSADQIAEAKKLAQQWKEKHQGK